MICLYGRSFFVLTFENLIVEMRYLRHKHRGCILIGNRKFSYFITDCLIKRIDEGGNLVYRIEESKDDKSMVFSLYLSSSKECKLVSKILQSFGIKTTQYCIGKYNERVWFNPLTIQHRPGYHFSLNYRVSIISDIGTSFLPSVFERLRQEGFKTGYRIPGMSISYEVIL